MLLSPVVLTASEWARLGPDATVTRERPGSATEHYVRLDDPLFGPTLRPVILTPDASQRPKAGDVVLLTGAFSIAEPGSLAVIGGALSDAAGRVLTPDRVRLTFGANAFRDHRGVSCSGGPVALDVPATALVRTGRVYDQAFWCWYRGPEAGGAFPYRLTVPVWEWAGEAASGDGPARPGGV